jgi:hypothetical protein
MNFRLKESNSAGNGGNYVTMICILLLLLSGYLKKDAMIGWTCSSDRTKKKFKQDFGEDRILRVILKWTLTEL